MTLSSLISRVEEGSELASASVRPEPSSVGLHAQVTPFSSVVGQSVLLTDETGAAVAQLSISVPDPSRPYRETAEEIARVVELAINQPPSEEVKKLRVRLARLMEEDARRMASAAAGSDESTIRCALAPFARIYAETTRDWPSGLNPERADDRHAWGFNGADLTWGDFRRAWEVLENSPAGLADAHKKDRP